MEWKGMEKKKFKQIYILTEDVNSEGEIVIPSSDMTITDAFTSLFSGIFGFCTRRGTRYHPLFFLPSQDTFLHLREEKIV